MGCLSLNNELDLCRLPSTRSQTVSGLPLIKNQTVYPSVQMINIRKQTNRQNEDDFPRGENKVHICHDLFLFQAYVHGNARCTENQQQNHHQYHVRCLPRRSEDSRRVPRPGEQTIVMVEPQIQSATHALSSLSFMGLCKRSIHTYELLGMNYCVNFSVYALVKSGHTTHY